jgi:virulence factor Mce-like protein
MNTLAPPRSRVLVMIAFACSCVGLLLFLWVSFGGTLPFEPQGYRFSVEFDQAVQLGTQADVRIAGVNVGKVVSVGLDRHTGLTKAEIEIFPQFAPRPADTRAILRQKSLLGETFVELSSGNPHGPVLLDGGRIPQARVAPTVQLDQILSTFDPATRRAFQVWMQQDGIAFTGRGQDFNDAIAHLYPFATNIESVLSVLRRDQLAASVLLRDGGRVFSALSASPSQLQGFVTHSNAVFAATAAQDQALANTIRAFPAFLVATRQTVDRLNTFAIDTQPLIDELRPAAVPLSQALQVSAVLAPQLRDVLVDVGPLTTAAKTGEPALERFLDETVPLLTRLTPYLGGVVPIINYLNDYRREIAAFFANSTASTQATLPGLSNPKLLHYLRISNPVNPETLTAYQHRPSSNRSNAYMTPGGYEDLLKGFPAFAQYLCTSYPLPSIGPTVPATLVPILQSVYFTAKPQGPACRPQAPLGETLTGLTQDFPHLQQLP